MKEEMTAADFGFPEDNELFLYNYWTKRIYEGLGIPKEFVRQHNFLIFDEMANFDQRLEDILQRMRI